MFPGGAEAPNDPELDMSSFPLPLDQRFGDHLYDCLLSANCVNKARLVCRAFRDLLDASARRITLYVREEHKEILEKRDPAVRSPLLRWPRCESLGIYFLSPRSNGAGWISAMPRLLFDDLPSDARARITILMVATRQYNGAEAIYGDLTLGLAAKLPALKILNVHDFRNTYPNPRGEAPKPMPSPAFFSALAATCPQLEHLALPSFMPLDGAEALAGSLNLLMLGKPPEGEHSRRLPPDCLRSLSQLAGLRTLSINNPQFCDFRVGFHRSTDALVAFLDSLPRSLEVVHLNLAIPYEDVVNVKLQYGTDRLLTAVDVQSDPRFTDLRVLAAALLLCRAMGPRLGRLGFQMVGVMSTDTLSEADTADLRQLMQRCARVDVHTMYVSSYGGTSSYDMGRLAARGLELFGVPQVLRLQSGAAGNTELRLRAETAAAATIDGLGEAAGTAAAATGARGQEAGMQPAAAGGDPAPAPAALTLQTADRCRVLQAAVDREWAQATAAAAAAAAAPQAAGATGALGSATTTTTSSNSKLGSVVLVRGLNFNKLPTKVLKNWFEGLSSKLRRTPEARPIIGFTRLLVESYMVLPGGGAGAGALLFQCSTDDVAALFRDLVEGDTGINPQAPMQAVRLRSYSVSDAVAAMVKPLLEELWAGSSAASGERERRQVKRLVELYLDSVSGLREVPLSYY